MTRTSATPPIPSPSPLPAVPPVVPAALTDALAAALDRGATEGATALARLDAALPGLLGVAHAGAAPTGAAPTGAAPVTDGRDRALALLAIGDLLTGPVQPAARWAGHPAIARLRFALETSWLEELAAVPLPSRLADPHGAGARTVPGRVVAALRALAARDRLPPVYRWVAREASWHEVVAFLALEGGPDAGFDDLVAACQVGLGGRAKLELAVNYWDEMGNGALPAVHTVLHERLVEAIDMPRIPRTEQPVEGLERVALGTVLATNHWLQPEMLGALGLTELQAGPRCRLILAAFDRLGAPRAAYPFYEVHADVDPRHGRDWVDNAVVPVLAEHPDWAERIVRGAWWRSLVNRRFFAGAQELVQAGLVRRGAATRESAAA